MNSNLVQKYTVFWSLFADSTSEDNTHSCFYNTFKANSQKIAVQAKIIWKNDLLLSMLAQSYLALFKSSNLFRFYDFFLILSIIELQNPKVSI